MARCAIALGGNIGDTARRFEAAYRLLARCNIRVERRSEIIETPPMGEEAGDPFLNAAAVAETPLEPQQLLQTLHDIEDELGRERTIHWGPRTLDLDLLLYDQEVVDSEDLVVPHPGLWLRRFVLQPLIEIAPEWHHPNLNETISKLFQRINARPLTFEIEGLAATGLTLNSVNSEFEDDISAGRLSFSAATEAEASDRHFARINLKSVSRTKCKQTQPRHCKGREIEIEVSTPVDRDALLTSLQTLASAALG